MKTKSRAVAQEEILFESTNRFYLFSPSRIRFLATGAEASKPASRGFHANGVKRMGGHGHDEPYYLHAKHMYNLHRMKHQKRNVTLSVLGAVGIGVGVPVYAVIFQQKKTASA